MDENQNENEKCNPLKSTTGTTSKRYEIYLKSTADKNFNKSSFETKILESKTYKFGVNYIKDDDEISCVIVEECKFNQNNSKNPENPEKNEKSSKNEFIYVRLSPDEEIIEDFIEQEENEENITSAYHYILPCKSFLGLWENLIYNDSNLKPKLLNFMRTIQLFSQKSIDTNIICLNKLILLTGLPGSGKTSLCKALCQKLTVQLVGNTNQNSTNSHDRYTYGQLIEVNSHSLFSKWFSESGKLVSKMFNKIKEIALDKNCLVFVLIDEIESITSDRKNIDSNTEPTDSIRVVNSVLTQLDSLKTFSNILVLATSNLTEKIDEALIDRADLNISIPLPGINVLQKLFKISIKELYEKGILDSETFNQDFETKLNIISKIAFSKKFSGRGIKKLPLIACIGEENYPISLCKFLENLNKIIEDK